MDDPGVRDRETRTADTLAMLTTQGIDVWVATASAAGAPYLVPVSLAWVDDRAVIAVATSSLTASQPDDVRRSPARRGTDP